MPDLQRYPKTLCVCRELRYVCVNLSKPACVQMQIQVFALYSFCHFLHLLFSSKFEHMKLS